MDLAGLAEGGNHRRRTLRGRVGVEDRTTHGDTAAAGDFCARLRNFGEHRITAGKIDIADVDLEADQAGNAVDRTGEDVADAGGADAINRSSRAGCGLDS